MIGADLKLTCTRDELVSKLGVVARGVSTRSAVQILSGVLLRAEGGVLQLAATDMELSLRTSLGAQVEGDGAVVVPGRLLVDLTRLLPENEVAIEHRAEESVLRITCGSAEYRLHTYSAEDFPRLPEVGAAQMQAIDAEALLDTIGRVSRAASRDDSRPVLTGIFVRFAEGKLVMAATDSYRLSVKETPLEGAAPDLEAIIPARALEELRRIVEPGMELSLGVHTGGQGGRDIYLFDRAAKKFLPLPGLNSVAHEQTPSISVDGRYIAFVSERFPGEGERDIFLYDREAQKLLPTPGLNSKREDIDPCVIVLK